MAGGGSRLPPRAAALDGGLPFRRHRRARPAVRPRFDRRLRRTRARLDRRAFVPGPRQREVQRSHQLRTTDAHRPEPLVAAGDRLCTVVEPHRLPLPDRCRGSREPDKAGVLAGQRRCRLSLPGDPPPDGPLPLRGRALGDGRPRVIPRLPVGRLAQRLGVRCSGHRALQHRTGFQAGGTRLDRVRHPAVAVDRHRVDPTSSRVRPRASSTCSGSRDPGIRSGPWHCSRRPRCRYPKLELSPWLSALPGETG